MATQPKVYTRLTRNAMGVTTFSSLWLAADHLLIVRSTGLFETYSRVMLHDIKAMFVIRSDRRLWWGMGWGLMVLIFAIRALVTALDKDLPIASGICLLLSIAGLILNQWMGPGCAVHVVTGVQTAQLPSLIRWRKTRQVLDRLEPLVRAAQADLVKVPAPSTEVLPQVPPTAVA